ncbi:hypothetical protein BJX99DRAFT_36825 [Aspergillus californicus]
MERLKVLSTYGQSCTQCYKAKCRCVRLPSGDKCERCLRLKKRCDPSDSVRRRNVQPVGESDTRIARLEDKMESLLTTMQSFISSQSSQVQLLNGDSIPSSTTSANITLLNPQSTILGSQSPSAGLPSPALSPWPNQADERLNFFRSRMLPFFPFIDLTPDMTSWYLRQHRPFLFQAIHTVTTFSTQERLVQVEELKRLLFTSALLNTESSIDLLLGLLTYLAWSTDAFLGRADLISRLMMLAISQVCDLRLLKPSSLDVQLMMTITQGGADDSQNPNHETPHGLLERRRAVLACFILSSNIASHLGRQDAIRWTPQMEEDLRVLTINESCATDKLFVAQVRLQLLKQKADYVRQQDDETDFVRTGTASGPRLLYLKTLRRQLVELRSSFPPDIQYIGTLNAHAQYVELYINQLAYSIYQNPSSSTKERTSTNGEIIPGFERLTSLWHSVQNIKFWLEHFSQVPSAAFIAQPFHFWSQMVLVITLLKYLSTLNDPDWDCRAVQSTVNLIETMDWMAQKLEEGGREVELAGVSDHLLGYLGKLLRRCRGWAEGKMATAQSRDRNEGQDIAGGCRLVGSEVGPESETDIPGHGHSHIHQIPDLDQIVWLQSMDLGDEQWFKDVLGIPATMY